jgi:hypothetical protein
MCNGDCKCKELRKADKDNPFVAYIEQGEDQGSQPYLNIQVHGSFGVLALERMRAELQANKGVGEVGPRLRPTGRVTDKHYCGAYLYVKVAHLVGYFERQADDE